MIYMSTVCLCSSVWTAQPRWLLPMSPVECGELRGHQVYNETRQSLFLLILSPDIAIYFQQGEYSVEEGSDLSVHLNISGHIQYPFTVEVLPCSQLNGPIPDTKIPDGANKATSEYLTDVEIPIVDIMCIVIQKYIRCTTFICSLYTTLFHVEIHLPSSRFLPHLI